MNPLLETIEEEPVESVADLTEIPEDVIQGFTGPEMFAQQLQVLSRTAMTLTPTNELSVKQCAAFVETCTVASRYAEKRRHEIVDEPNKKVKDANAVWMPIVEGFASIAKRKSGEVSQWVTLERRKAEEEQRKALADAKTKQDELDRKAKEERDEAERLRLEADKATSIDEADVLHQQADRLEKKADKHELAASYVTSTVVPQQAKTVDLGTSKLVTKAPKKKWMLAGWDVQKPLKVTDIKLRELVGDPSKLPEGVRFLLQHSDLNPVYLNKSFGVIPFPEPFGEIEDFGGSALRQKA